MEHYHRGLDDAWLTLRKLEDDMTTTELVNKTLRQKTLRSKYFKKKVLRANE